MNWNRTDSVPPQLMDVPLDAFPPKMRHTADELIRSGGHPAISGALIWHYTLLCAQPLVDGEMPHCGIVPISSFVYINAVSGSGKTVLRAALEQPFIDCQLACEANDAQAMRQYEAAAPSWGLPVSFAGTKPESDEPIYATRLLTDLTPESIADQFMQCRSLGVSDDEGQVLTASWFRRSVPAYIHVLDGHTQLIARRTTGTKTIVDPRGSILISVQPEVTDAFDTRHGRLFRQSGFAPRGLMVQVPASAPRFMDVNNLPAPPKLDVWRDQVAGLLGEAIIRARHGITTRHVIRSTPQAKRCAAALHNEYQRRSMSGGDLAELPEHGPRQMERAIKLAVGMNVLEGLPGEVSGETMERAAQMVRWGTEHYKHRFMPKPKVPAAELHAQTLHLRLTALVKDTRQREFELRGLVDTAPNIGLSTSQAKRAFDFLCNKGYARYVKYGNKQWVELSPEQYPLIRFRT
ncbi:DUF3987 domain-containing protein [Burkholderia pseudomallei]|uniref:DUF3987 domain-containing protein n=1 Tax=Burkholderia pseudomallei TaxID=28450 RepID=UPI0009B2210C|nr:DUF3987 domain-containing protein [Burkholderia pseudomallei]